MKNMFIIGLFLSVLQVYCFAQNIEFAISESFNFDKMATTNSRNTLFKALYAHEITKNLFWKAGVSAGTAIWGNEVDIEVGLKYLQPISNKWSWCVQTSLINGLALFYPQSMYVMGAESKIGISYKINNKSNLCLATGLKYLNCPDYKSVSAINIVWSIPVSVSYIICL